MHKQPRSKPTTAGTSVAATHFLSASRCFPQVVVRYADIADAKLKRSACVKSLPRVVVVAVTAALFGGCAHTDDVAKEAAAYQRFLGASNAQIKVQIRSGERTFSGGGVWLGDGEVLTAFHLFYEPPRVLQPSDQVSIVFRGVVIPAKVVFHGDLRDNDLAMLKLEHDQVPSKLATLDTPSVCGDVEPVGAPLYITAYDAVYSTTASPVGTMMHKGKTWARAVTSIVSHGVSGSPVFDKGSGCLAGIISRIEYSPQGNMADPAQVACEKATLQMNDAGLGVTCAVSPQTIFSTSEAIEQFIDQAHQYERAHGIN